MMKHLCQLTNYFIHNYEISIWINSLVVTEGDVY